MLFAKVRLHRGMIVSGSRSRCIKISEDVVSFKVVVASPVNFLKANARGVFGDVFADVIIWESAVFFKCFE